MDALLYCCGLIIDGGRLLISILTQKTPKYSHISHPNYPYPNKLLSEEFKILKTATTQRFLTDCEQIKYILDKCCNL